MSQSDTCMHLKKKSHLIKNTLRKLHTTNSLHYAMTVLLAEPESDLTAAQVAHCASRKAVVDGICDPSPGRD